VNEVEKNQLKEMTQAIKQVKPEVDTLHPIAEEERDDKSQI
jgi:hypothetical protein